MGGGGVVQYFLGVGHDECSGVSQYSWSFSKDGDVISNPSFLLTPIRSPFNDFVNRPSLSGFPGKLGGNELSGTGSKV
jgi:hypothetical protein